MLIMGTARPGLQAYTTQQPLQDADIYSMLATLTNKVAKLEREMEANRSILEKIKATWRKPLGMDDICGYCGGVLPP